MEQLQIAVGEVAVADHRVAARVGPAVVFTLVIDAAGQFLGFLLGTGSVLPKVARLEMHRDQRVANERQPELSA